MTGAENKIAAAASILAAGVPAALAQLASSGKIPARHRPQLPKNVDPERPDRR